MRTTIALLVGIILGLLSGEVRDLVVSPAEAQSPGTRVVLMGIHPTSGAAIPVSVTTQGYINTKVIP
jgi:hypothetical protein